MEFTAIRSSTAAGGCPSPPLADHQAEEAVVKEHMFDKVVTRSDVGKLNRLVIPKQHAEKYFPLHAPSTDKQGLLLSFEDPDGKPWRFRYSYWNSSQSYVMTKGWSRFVKDKRLDAGDTVSFGRGVGVAGRGRLFIDWHRRPLPHVALVHHPVGSASLVPSPASVYDYDAHSHHHHHRRHDGYGAAAGRQVLFYHPQQQYHHHHQSVVLDSVAAVPGHPEPSAVAASGSKWVRLFGVNLECATDAEEAADAADVTGVVVVQEREVLFES